MTATTTTDSTSRTAARKQRKNHDDDDDDHFCTLVYEVRRRQRVDTPPWSRSLVWTL
jgi:hypothetical protein